MIETMHERTPEAKARCKFGPGSCHDCAMTCPYGNQVRDDHGTLHPCGTDVFNLDGSLRICAQCRQAHGEN